MSTDIMTLGGLVFDEWSAPEAMMFGGHHGAAVHKLPGGKRVVDTLGPDDSDIHFVGMFWGDNAEASALALEALRVGGHALPLVFGWMFRQVIVIEALPIVRRFPSYYSYAVTCLVVSNPMQGVLGLTLSSVGDLVAADMATAMSIVGL